MIRRFNAAAIFTLVLVFSTSLFAQSAPVTGRVVLQKADGTTAPIVGALVEAIQIDIKSSAPPDKTDKKGYFSFAGLKLGAVYALSVSGPGAAPRYLPNIRGGNENLLITLTEGDGSRLSEDDVRIAAKGGKVNAAAPGATAEAPKGELTAEQKKQQAEYLAKKTEVESKNAKAVRANEVVNKALQDGNAAFTAKNYDVAITHYDEGINADPDFAGSAPVLLNNKGTTLYTRGVMVYNQNAKGTDAATKIEAFKKVRKDFGDSVDSFDRSLKIIKAVTPADGADPKVLETNKINALRGMKDAFRYMAATEQVDDTKLPIAKAALPEYVAIETDAAKKEEAKLILADVYRVAGDSENAIVAYRQVLEGSPENIDAMAGLGLSLVNQGYVSNNKVQLQEGANVLQKFASMAPATNKYKDDALGLIETLKKEQNVTPVKTAGGKKKN